MKNIIKYTVYILLAFLLLNVVLTEGVARIMGQKPFKPMNLDLKVTPKDVSFFHADSLLGYGLTPGHFRMEYPDGYVFEATNGPDGYRQGIPYDTSAQGDIWVFGCSYTYGWAVADTETFCYELGKILPEFNVKNYGVSGYGNLQNLLDLKQKLQTEISPRVVIFTYGFMHDERNAVSRSWLWKNATFTKHTGPIELPAAKMVDSSLQISYVPLVYQPWTLSDISAFMFWLERKNMDAENDEFAHSGTTEQILLQAQKACYARGIGFAVALIMDDDRTRAVGEFCKNHDIRVRLIAPDWDQPGMTNKPTDPHPSPAGHDSLAAGLLQLLVHPMGD